MARITLRIGAVLLLAFQVILSQEGVAAVDKSLQTKIFRSPVFNLGPGDVIDKYYKVEMPQGHVALRSFDAQVVDENGIPITLFETYLHHWVLLRFYVAKTTASSNGSQPQDKVAEAELSNPILVPNSGVCSNATNVNDGNLAQYFGLGSETRATNTTVPPPYGIVVGDPKDVPEGFEELWVLNVHAIDTRGAIDRLRCTECVCELYNVTVSEEGEPLPAGYEGGLHCCRDETHCAVEPDFEGSKRDLYMEYTVSWVEMSDQVVPVKVYILDITDVRKASNDDISHCKVEYTVDKCHEGSSKCTDKREAFAFLPEGGDVIYAVAHQHTGGIGSTLHNEDGKEICSSVPIYGTGSEVANESGYIVGMTTCYPEPGSVQIKAGEKLHHVSLYNSSERHTGVMGLFYLLVADSPPRKRNFHTNLILVGATIIAAFVFIGLTVSHLRKRRGRSSKEPIPARSSYEPIPARM